MFGDHSEQRSTAFHGTPHRATLGGQARDGVGAQQTPSSPLTLTPGCRGSPPPQPRGPIALCGFELLPVKGNSTGGYQTAVNKNSTLVQGRALGLCSSTSTQSAPEGPSLPRGGNQAWWGSKPPHSCLPTHLLPHQVLGGGLLKRLARETRSLQAALGRTPRGPTCCPQGAEAPAPLPPVTSSHPCKCPGPGRPRAD